MERAGAGDEATWGLGWVLVVGWALFALILDNWCGVVYDPSGLMLDACRSRTGPSDLGGPALQEAKMLFGGVLCGCEPLGGDWYFCSFT